MNIPNALTVLRMVLAPIIVLLLISADYRWWPAGLFAAAALLDYLDGKLARRFNWITDLGKILDPIADKVLILSVLWALYFIDDWLPISPIILITVFEMIKIFGHFLVSEVIPATKWGKRKMVAQVIAALALILNFYGIGIFLLWLVVILTAYSTYELALKVSAGEKLRPAF